MILLLSGNLTNLMKTSYTWLNIHVSAVTGYSVLLNLPATQPNLHAAKVTCASTLGGLGHVQLQDWLPGKRDHPWEGWTTLTWLWNFLIIPAGNSHFKSHSSPEKSRCQKWDKTPDSKSSLITYEADIDWEPWVANAAKLPLLTNVVAIE